MKKVLYIIKEVIIWAIAILAVCAMIFTIVSSVVFDRTDRTFLGYQLFIVKSDSMAATDFKTDDLIYVKTVDPATLKEGDIISFVSQEDESFGETITHKIRRLTEDSNGYPGFVTYGTTTNTDDAGITTYAHVIGKYQGMIPGVGKFFTFLKTTPGYILCIFLPFLILIVYYAFRIFNILPQVRHEQTAKLKEERRKLEEEKQESARILKQMQELQAQLAQQQDQTASDKQPNSIQDANASTEKKTE